MMMMKTSFNNELQQLQMELRAQNFDIIRFSTYRTACKLRFIQKKLNFHHLDLLNVIESLRESLISLSSERHTSTPAHSSIPHHNLFLSINHLTTFLTSIYTNLNKRLPFSQQILHIDHCVHSAIAWFLYVYNTPNNSIRFNSFRVVLILLCSGKLIDKMRHLFTSSLTTSSTHTLTYAQIDELLHEILALPYALQEISHSTSEKNYAQTIFSHLSSPISLNQFLDILIYNNSTPNCLQWLIIFHRLISVENVIHRVKCSACQRPSFSGFRYKCLQCHHRTYQLCQDCFWRGRTSHHHLSTHEMKEYTYFITPNKDLRNSIRRSFQCMPKNEKRNQLTIDKEQRVLERNDDTSNIQITNDEHKQIASYTNQLAYLTDKQSFRSTRRAYSSHQRAEKKLIISKLEAENRRIQHEINTLRGQLKHQSLEQIVPNDYGQRFSSYQLNDFHPIRRAGSVETTNKNSYFAHELQALLNRQNQLDSRIRQLQQSREELTSQLDNLERGFNPYGRLSVSPLRMNSKNNSFRSYSTPTTPVHNRMSNHLRTDLLLAADSLTSAMSSLVHQLNTEENDSILTAKKTNRQYNYYPYGYRNRIDDESFFTSDDDDNNNDRALYFSPINHKGQEKRLFM